MSLTIDVNVLLYASDDASPLQGRAGTLLESLAAGPEIVYLFWPTLMAYLRIGTHPAVFASPLTPAQASSNIGELVSLPHSRTVGEQPGFWPTFREVAERTPARGNQVSDAHLVALMVENEVRTIYTHDRDFRRFEGIDVIDPFD